MECAPTQHPCLPFPIQEGNDPATKHYGTHFLIIPHTRAREAEWKKAFDPLYP
jgi:hypothetical protein